MHHCELQSNLLITRTMFIVTSLHRQVHAEMSSLGLVSDRFPSLVWEDSSLGGPSWIWWWIAIHNKRRLVWQIIAKLSWWLNQVYCNRRLAAENGDKRSTRPDGIWEMSSDNAVMQMTCLQHKLCMEILLSNELNDGIYWTWMIVFIILAIRC